MPQPSEDLVIASADLDQEMTLLDILDHVLNAGVVIRGSLVISLVGVDLVFLGLDVVLTSVETAFRHMRLPDASPSVPSSKRSLQ
jgi:gas vesicle structural protein